MLEESAENLLRAIYDPTSTQEQINKANDTFIETFEKSSVDEANEVLLYLTEGFNCEDPTRAAFVALICNYLVDAGCDAVCLGRPLVRKIQELLQSSSKLFDACVAPIQEDVNNERERVDYFERMRLQKSRQMPEEASAWETLNHFWPPAISFLESSKEFRDASKPLIPIAKKLSAYHKGAHWLYLMISVLTDEPILVIEPNRYLGFVGRMSGIVDNFQLHTFLMDVFPDRVFRTSDRISSFMRSVIDGTGPRETEQIVTGKWNLYTWKALKSDLSLSKKTLLTSHEDWIWGEGVPADIDVFEGYRVILLGPPSYERTWRLLRTFEGLPASIEIQQKLSENEVKQWLSRIASGGKHQ